MAEKKTDRLTQNMRFYVQVQDTPPEAQKPFDNGRFKGTDVNPMWRIKMLTQVYGPVGIGWWTENENYVFEPCQETGETAVFCTLDLRYRDPETGEVSQPVHGVGGNKFVASQRTGKYCNDEAYKMAYTDALSIACKALGFSHDIYFANDRTKYTMAGDNNQNNESNHTTSSVDLVNQIDAKLKEIGSGMSREEKNSFVIANIAPIIGSANFKTCTDVSKLQSLLTKLNNLNKAA